MYVMTPSLKSHATSGVPSCNWIIAMGTVIGPWPIISLYEQISKTVKKRTWQIVYILFQLFRNRFRDDDGAGSFSNTNCSWLKPEIVFTF